MLTASRNGRTVNAMMLPDPVDRCLGVVQCALPGCEAYLPLIVKRYDSDTAAEQIEWFLNHHECRGHAAAAEAEGATSQRERAASIARIRRLVAEGPPRENLRARQLAELVPPLLQVADELALMVEGAAGALDSRAPRLAKALRKGVALVWPGGIK